MTETALVPETPTNPVKTEPGAAAVAPPASATEGPASGETKVVLDAAVKQEEPAADAATVAVAAGAEGVKKEEAPAAAPVGEPDLGKIRGLLEFYFGDHNYRRDKFMQNEAAKHPDGTVTFFSFDLERGGINNLDRNLTSHPNIIDFAAGHIPITVLLTFNKLKAITTDPVVVARALEEGGPSAVVAVSWELN